MTTSKKIIEFITSKERVSPIELTRYLDISDRAVRKQLKTLYDKGILRKIGTPPRVYYYISKNDILPPTEKEEIDKNIRQEIESNFMYITPRGTIERGWLGFVLWCNERSMNVAKAASSYHEIQNKYKSIKKNNVIDGTNKFESTFADVYLERVFYVDFYSIEVFGKTRLGQLLLFAKQSQDKRLINSIADEIKPSVMYLIDKYNIDGVGFIPPTVKRELQLIRQIKNRLDLNVAGLEISKIKTQVAVPQKTLTKLQDRIVNAHETINVDSTRTFHNILLIDDAVGSGATLNETARSIRTKNICDGKIYGLAITGSVKGFDVISEV